ncbi:MAG: mechanosensitive ion channel family protein [Cyanobacteria bacterium P01_E01_bin.6]
MMILKRCLSVPRSINPFFSFIYDSKWSQPFVLAAITTLMIVSVSSLLPAYGYVDRVHQRVESYHIATNEVPENNGDPGTDTRLLEDRSPENRIDGFSVFLAQQELFVIQASIGSFSAQERAEVIESRIQAIATDSSIEPDNLIVEEDGETTISIVLDNKVIVTITEADAQAARLNRRDLANQYRQIITTAIRDFRYERSAQSLSIAGIYVAIATASLLILIILIQVVFSKIRHWLLSLQNTRLPNLRIQNAELLSAERTARMLIRLAKFIRWVTIVSLLYFYLTFVLSRFPWTRPIGENLIIYLLAAIRPIGRSIIGYIPNLLTLIFIGGVTHYLIKFVKLILRAIEQGSIAFPGFHREWIDPTRKLVLFRIIVLAVVIAFPYLPGADSPAFRGISIVLGVIFSLGSTTAVSNIVSGIILIYTRAFEIGDRVKIGDAVGNVEETTLLVIQLRTPKNEVVTIPNFAVLNNNVINFSATVRQTQTPLILNTTITLGYDVPWRDAYAALISAAQQTQHILSEPIPFVLQTSLDDFYVSYQLNAYTNEPTRMAAIYSELHQNIQDRCNEAGIEILSPHYSAVRDGHQITIPESYLSTDYAAPSFRLQLMNALFPSNK